MDPGVQSVRVASALCDRFGVLIAGPSAVSMTKESGALFGVSGNESELSLRIGEVQQIYPEIWRHLDEARKAFAARGVDVSAYDRIRAGEGLAIGANVDVQHKVTGDVDHFVKSANFNKEGFQRARAACDALMKATPEIDWAGIAKREADDPAIHAFTASTNRKRWLMFGLLGLVIASPFLWVFYKRWQEQRKVDERREAYEETLKLSAEDKTRLKSTLDEARAAIAESRKAWPQVTAPDALAAITPGTGPCEYRFRAPSARAAESFVKYGSIDASYFGQGTYTSYLAGQPIPDERLARDLATVDELAKKLAAGDANRHDADRMYKLESHVVFVVIDREIQPVIQDTGADLMYVAGELHGRAYVFSAHAKKIVCAAQIEAKNGVEYVELRSQYGGSHTAARGVLQRDLEVKVREALAASLRAVP